MKRIATFIAYFLLIGITFAIVFFTALTYRAVERTSVKTYIFQTNNSSKLRIGALQDINDISAIELRNKLIKKYVFEFFKVIPGDRMVINRRVLRKLSSDYAFKQWLNTEANTIAEMSEKKMFRRVKIMDDGILTVNKPANKDYDDKEKAPEIFYEIHYLTETWKDSNIMMVEPEIKPGILFIEARFKPGLDPDIDIKKELEAGLEPVELFKFEVTNIGSRGIK